MSTRDQLIKARFGVLALADELKNIATACRLAGVRGELERSGCASAAPAW